jgi:hypothetical protein
MRRDRPFLFALLLIGVGVVLLLQQAEVIPEDVSVWPIVLIGVGILLLVERALAGGPRGSGFVVPLVVIAIGTGFLLQDAGAFEGDDVLLPLVAIAIGLGLVLGAMSPRHGPAAERAEVALAGATRARIEIEHGAGELHIRSHGGEDHLVRGTFAGGVEVDERRTGDLVDVRLHPASWRGAFSGGRRPGLEWSVELARGIAVELTVRTGASRAEMDLSDLRVESLAVDTGAGAVAITVPASGRPSIRIRGGAADIRVSVPPSMAARIDAQGGLSSVRVDGFRFPRDGGGYRSANYDDAIDRADIVIEAGAASVQVG